MLYSFIRMCLCVDVLYFSCLEIFIFLNPKIQVFYPSWKILSHRLSIFSSPPPIHAFLYFPAALQLYVYWTSQSILRASGPLCFFLCISLLLSLLSSADIRVLFSHGTAFHFQWSYFEFLEVLFGSYSDFLVFSEFLILAGFFFLILSFVL